MFAGRGREAYQNVFVSDTSIIQEKDSLSSLPIENISSLDEHDLNSIELDNKLIELATDNTIQKYSLTTETIDDINKLPS